MMTPACRLLRRRPRGVLIVWTRHALLLVGLFLSASWAHSQSGKEIHVRDHRGADLVVFYPDGNISVLYGWILMGPEADLATVPDIGEFVVENAQGEVVFRIAEDSAHIHMKGQVEQGIGSTLRPKDPLFTVQNSEGDIVAYIDDDGNLKTKGIIYMQGIATDGLQQRDNVLTSMAPRLNSPEVFSTDDLVLSGDASMKDGSIDFTSGRMNAKGAAWSRQKIPVGSGFTANFDVDLSGDGIEGLAYVIQNDSKSPPLSPGGKLGYTGIVNSLAVEFDAKRSLEFSPPEINGNHISVNTRGPNRANSSDPAFSIGANYALSSNLKESVSLSIRIDYDSRKHTLKVYLNDTLELEIFSFDLNDHIEMVDGLAWAGIMVTSSGTDDVKPGDAVSSK